jgi:hypothetical protein
MSDAIQEVAAEPKAKKATVKQYKITFHGEGGDVEIAHNFKLNIYKRNIETTIDQNYLDVLKNAVVHTVVDGKSVSIPQFAYTIEGI